MTSESHYLLCVDVNCERFSCVARRDYENQIARLREKLDARMHSDSVLRADMLMSLHAVAIEAKKMQEALKYIATGKNTAYINSFGRPQPDFPLRVEEIKEFAAKTLAEIKESE